MPEIIDLKPGAVQLISTSVGKIAVTSVNYITYNPRKSLLTLFYTDKTKESAKMSPKEFQAISDENGTAYFQLVEFVQDKC